MTVNQPNHHQESGNVEPEMEGMSGVQQCPWSAAALLYGPGFLISIQTDKHLQREKLRCREVNDLLEHPTSQ